MLTVNELFAVPLFQKKEAPLEALRVTASPSQKEVGPDARTVGAGGNAKTCILMALEGSE